MRSPARGWLRRGTAARAGRSQPVEKVLWNGHVLTLNSLLTSALGAGYWALAAHLYNPSVVGLNYSAVAAMMLLAGLGQLNLTNVMIRFVPRAGSRVRRIVAKAYLAAFCTSLVLGTVFVLLIPTVSSGLMFLHTPLVGSGFVLAVAAYSIFVLEDGVLTGIRHPDWVVLENLAFAVLKIAFLAVLAFLATNGILWSWAFSVAITVLLTNIYLFGRALPRRERTAPSEPADGGGPTGGYIAADGIAALCWLVATSILPIMVVNRLGADEAAYFSLAWLVAFLLYQLNTNMGASLIVESANEPARLARHCRLVLRHTGALMAGAVAVLCVTAPFILRIFGSEYAEHGTGLLRLVALSALPNVVVATAVSACRARRRMRLVVGILATVCTLATVLSYVLLPVMGIAGVGTGWLIAQTVVAVGLLLGRRSWIPPHEERTDAARPPVQPEPDPDSL